jgi:hypothetical protein
MTGMTTRRRRNSVALIGVHGVGVALAVAVAASAASAQGRMITLSPASVRQGQTVRVTSPACSGALTVLLNGKLFPATANGTAFDVNTDALAPAAYAITVDCAGAASDPASLLVTAATAPRVMCARNASPRDGTAEALRSDVAAKDGQRVVGAKRAAEAAKQKWPTPEETALLLDRCDKDWVWTLRLEDRLTLDVDGYSDWMRVDANRQKPYHLFIDGIELGHIDVKHVSLDPATKLDRLEAVVSFEDDDTSVEGRTANRKALAQVLRTARAKKWDYKVNDMPVSIGPADGPLWLTTARIRINPYPPGLAIGAVAATLALALGLLYATWKTRLLRDGDFTSPFSLAKNQMALWFFIIFSAFLFVTVSTGQAAAMSNTALILIGISGGTGLAAMMIDRRKTTIDGTQRVELEAEKARITAELEGADGLKAKRNAANVAPAEITQLQALLDSRTRRLDAIDEALKGKSSPAPRKSQGWLTDILSDEFGLSFHRLQMAAWTVAMVGVFVVAVWRTFAMPEFDATMLGLLGISSGTYLGFKFPERDSPTSKPGP